MYALPQVMLCTLAVLYGLMAIWASVQFVRVHRVLPANAWTTQKLFHLFIGLMCTIRCAYWIYLLFTDQMQVDPWWIDIMWSTIPSLLYFSTYTLLVLFWVHVYHLAHSIRITSHSTTMHVNMRYVYYTVNGILVFIQAGIYGACFVLNQDIILRMNSIFFATWCLVTAVFFVVYGARLYLHFHRMTPVQSDSKERLTRMRRVGAVTLVASICFVVRAMYTLALNIDQGALMDKMSVEYYNVSGCVYFLVSEVIPSSIILLILRDLPRPGSKLVMIWNKSGLVPAVGGTDVESGRSSPLLDPSSSMYPDVKGGRSSRAPTGT
eukprot:TRINITY_DN11183_c0_g1_i1.p1 TRINITY_DN11183_c0_g1~~TRINITY_DN11183_c0_g1_i1.p1  ORF type:complete len:322 (+),score=14.71 TRINITY_DN11183_c0_g1_i1:201-1166(+)